MRRLFFIITAAIAVPCLTVTLHASEIVYKRFLPDQEIRCQTIDNHNRLWVGTNYGFSIINNGYVRDYTVVDEEGGSSSYSAVSHIIPSGKQALIATSSQLYLFDIEKEEYEPITLDGHNIIVSASVGVGDMAYFYSMHDEMFLSFSFADKSVELLCEFDENDHFLFQSLSIMPRHVLLADNSKGLYKCGIYDKSFEHIDLVSGDIIATAVTANQDGSLVWVPTIDGINCYRIVGESFEFKRSFSSQNSLLKTYDIQDIVAVGDAAYVSTNGSGLYHLNASTGSSYIYPGGFTSNLTSVIAPLNSASFIGGTSYNGLISGKEKIITDLSSTVISSRSTLTSSTVTSIYDDGNGFIWLGTDGNGLNRYDENNHVVAKYPLSSVGTISSIASYDDENLICILNQKDVVLFSRSSGKLVTLGSTIIDDLLDKAEGQNSIMVADSPKGGFYLFNVAGVNYHIQPGVNCVESFVFGTRDNPDVVVGVECTEYSTIVYSLHSVYELDNNTLMVRRLFNKENEQILDIASENAGSVYVATYSGLFCIDVRDGSVEERQELISSGLPKGICFDRRGKLWVINDRNILLCIDIPSGNTFYVPEAGNSPYTGFFSLATHDNVLYFSRSSGVMVIDADAESSRNSVSMTPPRTSVENLKLDGTPLALSVGGIAKAELPAKYNFLEFNLLVVSDDPLEATPINLVLYKDGKDVGSNYGCDPSYMISTMGPGRYQVKTSILTNSGWTAEETIMEIRVRWPWYFTWWAALIYISIIVSFIMFQRFSKKNRSARKLEKTANIIERQKDEEKIALMANLAHDLRSPLSLVQNRINTVLDERTDDELVSTTLRGTIPQISRMTDMVNMILSIHKMASTSEEIRYDVVNLNKWIADRLEYEYKLKCSSSNISLEFIPETRIQEISMDSSKIHACFQNLMTNAIKFSNGGTITISTAIVNNYIRISVADEGCGYTCPTENLFKKFYRQNTTVNGYGLGLAYVKTLIEKLGGIVSAFNNPSGVGSTFYFEFPLINIEGSATAVDRERNVDYDSSHDVIMVVDDQKDIRDYVVQIYKNKYRKVVTAPDGLQALQMLNDKHPDLIISDLIMPGMDGFELCKQVKSTIEISHIPFVLFSTKEDALGQHISYKLGPDDCIAKPFDIKLLDDIIKFQLKRRSEFKTAVRNKSIMKVTKDMLISKADEDFISKLDAFILGEEDVTPDSCAKNADMNVKDFEHKIESLLGISAVEYIKMVILND